MIMCHTSTNTFRNCYSAVLSYCSYGLQFSIPSMTSNTHENNWICTGALLPKLLTLLKSSQDYLWRFKPTLELGTSEFLMSLLCYPWRSQKKLTVQKSHSDVNQALRAFIYFLKQGSWLWMTYFVKEIWHLKIVHITHATLSSEGDICFQSTVWEDC